MNILDQIATLCRDLESAFTINNNWSGTKDDPQITYEWHVEGSQRGESEACAGYMQLDDCLRDCWGWLIQVKDLR